MHGNPMADSSRKMGPREHETGSPRPVRAKRRGVLPAACTLALCALSAVVAAPASLAGTTLCLSPTTSVFVSGVPGPNPYRLADRLYAEMKALFRTAGVRYTEAPVCRKSPAAVTLFLDVTPLVREPGVETQVSGRVDGESQGGAIQLSNSGLLWSDVKYGEAGTGETGIKARLLEDARVMLDRFVGDWNAANR